MTRVAIYDCGTNTTRLLVADVKDGRVTNLERHSTVTRLGESVDSSGVLLDKAIARTAEVLRQYGEIAAHYSCDATEIIATSCVRDANNSDVFVSAVNKALNKPVRLISGEEEAAFAFLGATHDVSWKEPTLLVDIGGGSTEFGFGIPGSTKADFVCSLQMGAVRVTEQFLHADPPKAEELSDAVSVVRDQLEQLRRDHPEIKQTKKFVGVAGTVTTVAAVELGLDPYDPDKIHHFELTRAAAEDVFRTLATEALADRVKNPGLDPMRADVIVGGMVILVSIMRTYQFDSCMVSERDLLDGAALSLAAG